MKDFFKSLILICLCAGSSIAQPFGSRIEINNSASAQSDVYSIDLDSDGDDDIISASSGTGGFAWYENELDGTFTEHSLSVITSSIGGHIEAGDLDGDGDIDIAYASGNSHSIDWYRNNGSEVFTKINLLSNYEDARDLKIIDFDSDGDLDIVCTKWGDAYAVPVKHSAINLLTNNGTGSFTTSLIFGQTGTTHLGAEYFDVSDIDSDGDMDVSVSHRGSNKFGWVENTGTGFTYHLIASIQARRMVNADFDGDGDEDILVSQSGSGLKLYSNNGSQVFTVSSVGGGVASDMVGVDMDADGDKDILIANNSPKLLTNNAGVFSSQNLDTWTGYQADHVHFGDFNSDGNLEPVTYNDGGHNSSVISIFGCDKPTALSANVLSCKSAILSWNDPNGTSWELEYGQSGFTLGTGTTVNTSSTSSTVFGLTASTNYEFYVRATCAGSRYSFYAGPYAFSTGECDPCDKDLNLISDVEMCKVDFTPQLPSITPFVVIGYEWTFGDGTSSNMSNPTHYYNELGDYGVCLTVSMYNPETEECCDLNYCSAVTIEEDCENNCDFQSELVYTVDECCNYEFGYEIVSGNPVNVKGVFWDFGDGTTGYGNNLGHVFPGPGHFTVCYTLVTRMPNGDCCTQTVCNEIQVDCESVSGRVMNPTNPMYNETENSKVGLDDNSSNEITDFDFLVFPNPSSSNSAEIFLKVETSQILAEILTIEIKDSKGSTISRTIKKVQELDNSKITLEISGLSGGAYYITLSDGFRSKTKLFIRG